MGVCVGTSGPFWSYFWLMSEVRPDLLQRESFSDPQCGGSTSLVLERVSGRPRWVPLVHDWW